MTEKTFYYFKLFNNIKDDAEIDFAELELNSLFGEVTRIRNLADALNVPPLNYFMDKKLQPPLGIRVQDAILHETCYGEFQGFFGSKEEIDDISNLVRRLAYTREIYVVTKTEHPEDCLKKLFPEGVLGINVQFAESGEYCCFRIITHQYFLEKSQYISKLSRNEEEVKNNVKTLFENLTNPQKFYRIPASSTMSVGKRLEDYFAIREEPSLYLTHYMHPYKGKFHPKMVRALLNYIHPENQGLVMDNFVGSGTLLVEATLMGIDNIGVEINPLSVLMSNVKCSSFDIPVAELREEIERFLDLVEESLYKFDREIFKKQKQNIPKEVLELFPEKLIEEFMIAHEVLKQMKISDKRVKDFLLLGLSGTISDLARRKKTVALIEALRSRLYHLYLRVFLFQELNRVLKIRLGKSITYIGDARDLKTCKTLDGKSGLISEITGIVTSPPYSTALDYIKNDLPQLVILNLPDSLDQLEKDMIGNPRKIYGKEQLIKEIKNNDKPFQQMPEYAKKVVKELLSAGRINEALRTYKFFKDMESSIIEMMRVLKPGSKCAVIIGNNHYKLDGEYEEVKNDEVFWELAEKYGLKRDENVTTILRKSGKNTFDVGVIRRELEKTQSGNIRYESVVFLVKR